MRLFLRIHDLLCQLLFGGEAPDWLLDVHETYGWD